MTSSDSSPTMRLRATAAALPAGAKELVADASQGAMAALHDIARLLLRATSLEVQRDALVRVVDVVRSAQRVSVVGWPPDAEHGLQPLVPAVVLERAGLTASPISSSLARHAVETRQALYYTEADDVSNFRDAPSVRAHQIRSAIYVPLLTIEGEILGLLCVDSPVPTDPILPRDFHFVRAVGALLSASLEADRLRDDARRREAQARQDEMRREAMEHFLKIASHDLKGPLAVVQMAVSGLAAGAEGPRREGLVADIRDATERARRLIDNYLVATQVDARQPLTLHLTEVDPRRLVDDELRFLRATFGVRTRDCRLVNEVSCRTLRADADRLAQIFANLLTNAGTYSAFVGEIRVSSTEVDGEVEFRVTDQGPGLPAEATDRLFGQFQRVGDRVHSRGTGLGLWVCVQLVEAHGGRMGVKRAAGGGASIWFTIPLAR